MLSSRICVTAARRTGGATKQSVRPFFSTFSKPDEEENARDGKEEEEEKSLRVPPLVRGDIVAVIAEEHEMSKAQADRVLTTVLDTIVENVSDKRTVRLANFGVFDRVERKARTGYNIQTGTKDLHIPSKERVRFRAYTAFKKSANAQILK